MDLISDAYGAASDDDTDGTASDDDADGTPACSWVDTGFPSVPPPLPKRPRWGPSPYPPPPPLTNQRRRWPPPPPSAEGTSPRGSAPSWPRRPPRHRFLGLTPEFSPDLGSLTDSNTRPDILRSLRSQPKSGSTNSLPLKPSMSLTNHTKAVNCVDWSPSHDMATRSLLDQGIDSKHRAALLESHGFLSPESIETLQTRTPKFNWMIHPEWVQRLKWAGLLPFARLVEATRAELVEAVDGEGVTEGVNSTRVTCDKSLLSCLVDRWRPETHTFHFRWGEMAPTLEDVSYLLGLPLAGEPIGPLEAPVNWEHAMDARFHGIRDGVGPLVSEKHGPRLAWVREFQINKLGYPAAQLTQLQITRCLEAYILWLLGKTMFTENHVNTISARYIPIAQEIADATTADDITPRSFGSAVLAATYRGMCNGCQLRAPNSSLLGCPLLLQLWSWERFSIGRPDILGQKPFPAEEMFDADRIDMPTVGTLWTRRKRSFAHNQVRNCYSVFSEQFDLYPAEHVIWEPYAENIIQTRYPGGLSIMCTRDAAYWMTRSKIIFDVSVEEMAQQRVMRQFGLCQLVDPPRADSPLPANIHKLTRKGCNKSATAWMQRVQSYFTEWENATTLLWPSNAAFEPELFSTYLQRYMPATRLCLTQAADPEGFPAPVTYDMYPSQSTSGTRLHAANLTAELQDDVARYTGQCSAGPLLDRKQSVSWGKHLEEKLRAIYDTLMCHRNSNVVHQRAAQQPPRPSTHLHQPRPQVPPPDFTRRQNPCPRFIPRASPRPPPPDQAGGSAWQQQPPSFDWWQQQQGGDFGWEQPDLAWHPQMGTPEGEAHLSSMSGSAWASDHDNEINMEDYNSHMEFFGNTPPPDPTQQTQYDMQWYGITPRHRGPPHRYGCSMPQPRRQAPRRAGRRG